MTVMPVLQESGVVSAVAFALAASQHHITGIDPLSVVGVDWWQCLPKKAVKPPHHSTLSGGFGAHSAARQMKASTISPGFLDVNHMNHGGNDTNSTLKMFLFLHVCSNYSSKCIGTVNLEDG
jgi:hypothetical protein